MDNKLRYADGLSLLVNADQCWSALAGQFVMSGFLNFKMAPWKRSCVTRTVAIVPTLVIAVVFQASHKLDQLNQLLNILQSIMLPFAIIPVSIPTFVLMLRKVRQLSCLHCLVSKDNCLFANQDASWP